MSERKKLEFISSITIMNTPMKKQKFIVDEIIYPELHILSDDPKIGKSWMMMDMCLSIAKGEKFHENIEKILSVRLYSSSFSGGKKL